MNEKTSLLYQFDEFRLDANRKCLWHSDKLVALTPKAFETLLVLVRHRGQIVAKEALLDEVWADTFVEESTLAQNILTLRKTLAAFERDKQFIVTIPRRGYRFVGDVQEIVGDEEMIVVEKRTRTHIVAEQIHESADAAGPDTSIVARKRPPKTFSRKNQIFIAALSGLIFLTALLVWLTFFRKTETFAAAKFQKFTASQLFSSASITRAVVSPNGKYLALVERRDDRESLVVRSIAEANSLEIVPSSDGTFIGAEFAPESDYLFYAVYPKNSRRGELYKIPVLGGAPQQILKDIDSAAAVSADQKRLAFIRRYPHEKETALMVTDLDGANERKLAVRQFGEGFQNAAFSPDGKFIASAAFSTTSSSKPMEIIIVDAQSGAQKSLAPESWTWIGQTVWLKDSSGIIFPAYGAKSPNLTDEIWFVSYPEGKARLLENGINGIFGISLTADSNSLLTVKSNKITSFAVSRLKDLAEQTVLLTKTGDESLLPLGADWTPDGKIVYSTINHGHADLWTMNADGGGQKQLTADAGADVSPKVAPDGRAIYFLSNRSGQMSVWRIDRDGANPQKLTENQEVFSLDVSPDGNFIYYTARAGNIFMQTLWRAAADGSGARALTDRTAFQPMLSPDGKTIACYFPDAENQKLKLTLLSAADGAVLRQIETPHGEGLGIFEWKKDGRELILATRRNGIATLWRLPLDERAPVKLKDWQNETIFRLAVSPDGESIFHEKGVTANSVLLLRDASETD